jgi:hypothetical protein
MDIMPVVEVGEAEKQRMALALARLLAAEPASRPDAPRWDWDDARFMLQRLKSPGLGEYDARARGLPMRLRVWLPSLPREGRR